MRSQVDSETATYLEKVTRLLHEPLQPLLRDLLLDAIQDSRCNLSSWRTIHIAFHRVVSLHLLSNDLLARCTKMIGLIVVPQIPGELDPRLHVVAQAFVLFNRTSRLSEFWLSMDAVMFALPMALDTHSEVEKKYSFW